MGAGARNTGRADRAGLGRRPVLAAIGVAFGLLSAACAGDDAPLAEPAAGERSPVPSAPPDVPTVEPPTPTPLPPPTPTPVPDGQVDLAPTELRQGTTALIRVWTQGASAAYVALEGREITLSREGPSFAGLLGIGRAASLGPRPLRVTLADAAGQRTVLNQPDLRIQVVDAAYPIVRLTVPASSTSLLDPVKVNEEEARLNAVYGARTPERKWAGPFVRPVQTERITSPFGERRSVNGGPANWWHEGTDYGAFTGDTVIATAAGTVALAAPLHVRGNTIVIDHGWGVMTGYFHLSQMDVQVGQDVAQGEQIGLVGSTGYVTGPHLHFEVRVHNVNVEPLEWLGEGGFQRPDLAF